MLRGCEKEEERQQLRDLVFTPPEERVAEDDDLPDWMKQHAPSWWAGESAAYRDGLAAQGMLSKLKQE